MELKFERTEHCLAIAEFRDLNQSACSLGESGLATEEAVWLGVRESNLGGLGIRMLLSREMVAALLPALHRFVRTGLLVRVGDER